MVGVAFVCVVVGVVFARRVGGHVRGLARCWERKSGIFLWKNIIAIIILFKFSSFAISFFSFELSFPRQVREVVHHWLYHVPYHFRSHVPFHLGAGLYVCSPPRQRCTLFSQQKQHESAW